MSALTASLQACRDALSMQTWHIIAAAIVLAVIAVALRGRARTRKHYAYRPAPILTKGERAFAHALEQCLPQGARLLAKVRLADVLHPSSPRDRGAFLKISQKHLDFVVTTQDWTVLAAIELNDKSHDAPSRQARDAFLGKAFEGAGIPLHFVPARAKYDPAELERLWEPKPATT